MGTGRAVTLIASQSLYAHNVWLTGSPPNEIKDYHTFKISINNIYSPGIRVDATASQVHKALSQIAGVKSDSFTVKLGTVQETSGDSTSIYLPFRWFIEFDPAKWEREPTLGTSGAFSIFRARSSKTLYTPNSFLDVKCVIPIGHPVTLKAGAIAAVSWYWGFGYGITGVEPRLFDCED